MLALSPSGVFLHQASPLPSAWWQLHGVMFKRDGVWKLNLDKVLEARIIDKEIMDLETGKQSNQG